MFLSKTRRIVVPQATHASFAGFLAYHWGNKQFNKPPLDFSSFTKAVENHHAGYGFLDSINFLELDNQQILEVFKKDCEADLGDPISELIIKSHNARLIKKRIENQPSENLESYALSLNADIEKVLSRLGLLNNLFLWTDRLTNLCDKISFDFCFEQTTSNEIPVYQSLEDTNPVPVKYIIGSEGLINVSPWPFSKTELTGYVQGYSTETYPSKLGPIIMPFKICPP